jgi:hypothetical protein
MKESHSVAMGSQRCLGRKIGLRTEHTQLKFTTRFPDAIPRIRQTTLAL